MRVRSLSREAQTDVGYLSPDWGCLSMSQDQTGLEDLQKRKAIADAEKAAIEAELARDDAKKKLADSQTPIDPQIKAKEAALDASKSAKEIADAQKARAEAEAAALKAKIGEVPQSGISGNVKLEQGAASFETALLAARAAVTASKLIADAVVQSASAVSGAKLLVFAAGEVPDFQAISVFFSQRTITLRALVDAVSLSDEATKAEAVSRTESVAAAGVALDAVTKLLGFFKSDFEVRGSEVTADHSLLARAVAGELLVLLAGREVELHLKGTFNPSALATVANTFENELASLTFQRDKAAAALIDQERKSVDLQTKLSAITGDTPEEKEFKRPLGEQQKRHQVAADKLKAALTAYDTLVSKLASPDANLTALVRELDVWSTLNEPANLLLLVKMDKAGGSNFTQKNLWTGIFGMPFKVMGGVIASYSLFQGSTGAVLASGVVPVHGGFSKVDEITQ